MAGRQKSDEKREAILAAASAEFAERDFHDVLMDDVSARAGVGKGTLYRYFPTKEELFIATVLRGLDTFHEQFLSMFEQDAPLEQILNDAVAHMLAYLSERAEFLTLVLRYEHRLPHADAEAWRQRRNDARRAIAAVLDREARRGHLRSVDTGLCAELLLGMVRSAIHSSIAEPRDPARTAGEIVSLFLHGVCGQAKTAGAATLRPVRVARGARA